MNAATSQVLAVLFRQLRALGDCKIRVKFVLFFNSLSGFNVTFDGNVCNELEILPTDYNLVSYTR